MLPLDEEAHDLPDSWGEVVTRDFRENSAKGPQKYSDLLSLSEPERDALPRAFDVVGDIVLLRLPESLASRKHEVGTALLRFVPGARLVGLDHGVHGPERRREVERIAGSGPWRTRHRENGLDLEVDLEKAYFSPRLAREHARIAVEVAPGERVYDLCCGVGPFALSIARNGQAAQITAVDANPEAIALLRSTLTRSPNADRVVTVIAPLEEFLARADPVERVVMNLPHEGIKYLPSVARTVAPGGRLYYYEVTPRTELPGRGDTLVNLMAAVGKFAVVGEHVVHPYSPASDLVVYDFARSE